MGCIAGLVIFVQIAPTYISLFLLPVPAFMDWTLYQLNIYSGNNGTRIVTGTILGIAYAAYLVAPFTGIPLLLWLIGVSAFVSWFALLLLLKRWTLWRRFGW